MLQPLGFVVDLVPRHAEDLGEHPLDQMMANDGALGDLPALRRKPNMTVALEEDEAILGEALQGKGHGRPGHSQPVREGGRDDSLPLSLSFGDRFQVVLF